MPDLNFKPRNIPPELLLPHQLVFVGDLAQTITLTVFARPSAVKVSSPEKKLLDLFHHSFPCVHHGETVRHICSELLSPELCLPLCL